LTQKFKLEMSSVRPGLAENTKTIAEKILDEFIYSIDHRQAVKVDIRLEWNPKVFFQQHSYESEYDDFLDQAVVLVGSGLDAQLTTVTEYLWQCWPHLADSISAALKSRPVNDTSRHGMLSRSGVMEKRAPC